MKFSLSNIFTFNYFEFYSTRISSTTGIILIVASVLVAIAALGLGLGLGLSNSSKNSPSTIPTTGFNLVNLTFFRILIIFFTLGVTVQLSNLATIQSLSGKKRNIINDNGKTIDVTKINEAVYFDHYYKFLIF